MLNNYCDCGCIYLEDKCPACNKVTPQEQIKELEAKLAKAEKTIAAAKEMYETAMLTGGGCPKAWVNHVRARNAFASTLAELKGQDDAVLHWD